MQIRSALTLALMSVALLSSLPRSATAQYPMPPRWEGPYYIVTGSRTGTAYTENQPVRNINQPVRNIPEQTTQTGDAPLPSPQYENAGQSINLSGNYLVKARYYWRKPGQTVIAPNPPAKVYLKVTARARYYADSGSASNSWDAVLPSVGGGESYGIHLIQKEGASGSFTVEVPLSASATEVESNPADTVVVNILFGCRVDIDQRGVTIGSSLGQTHYCDNSASHNSIPHIVDSDGTVHAHTRKPGLDHTITYTANPIGNWAANSDYHWYSAVKGVSVTGTFTLPNDPIEVLTNVYTSWDNLATPEHIHIRLTDSQDDADATGNYYVEFHEKYNHWTHDPNPTKYPRSLQTFPGDWVSMGIIDNPSAGTVSQAFQLQTTITRTMSGTIENEVSLDISGVAAFSHNESITIGQEVSIQSGLTLTFTSGQWEKVSCWIAQQWEARTEKCCVYGTSGFLGRRRWTGTHVTPGYAVGQRQERAYAH